VTLLQDDDSLPLPAMSSLPVDIALELETLTVAAYEQVGQQVEGTLRIENTGDDALQLLAETAASDWRWQLDTGIEEFEIGAGSQKALPVTLHIAADAWADSPVRVGVQLATADGRSVSTYKDVTANREALAVNPVNAWNIPASLRGGLDVARTYFGASATSDPPPYSFPEKLQEVFDGRVAVATGPEFLRGDMSPVTVTVDLAGDRPVPVAGFATNPTTRYYTHRTPRDVIYQLSMDGERFETVATDRITTDDRDHYLALENAIPARHARLILLNNWYRGAQPGFTLGAFKVIAEPGYDALAEMA
jgi:hypothetical protein